MYQKDQTQHLDPRWLNLLLEREMLSCYGGFIRGLIHNINGPLHNISMLVELIQTGLARLDRVTAGDGSALAEEKNRVLEREKQRLQKLVEQVGMLDGIMRDLRMLYEIERNPGEVDLNLLVLSLVQTLQFDLFFKHQVQLELRLAKDLPAISVPARHLIPSLVHLFRNAMTALREAPEKRLTIEGRAEAGAVQLSLRDTGCGLKVGEEERCFEPFYCGWPEAARESETHHGIGLFLVSAFLEPYAIKVALRTHGRETVASLEIPT